MSKRVRFFIDPTKSDEEIAEALVAMVQEHYPGYLKDEEGSSPGADFDQIWRRIARQAGETFTQKRGSKFRYRVEGNVLYPDRTNRALPRSQFQRAYERMPVEGPGDLQDLQGPSYLWAILTDARIRKVDGN